MKKVFFSILFALAAAGAARAQADVSGLWVADFMGNAVECHMEQRGQYLFGKAVVNTVSGERNTYTLAGVVLEGGRIRAVHGSSGNYFEGTVNGPDKASGTFYMVKSGQTLAMQAKRVRHGVTYPGGLEWPQGFPGAQ